MIEKHYRQSAGYALFWHNFSDVNDKNDANSDNQKTLSPYHYLISDSESIRFEFFQSASGYCCCLLSLSSNSLWKDRNNATCKTELQSFSSPALNYGNGDEEEWLDIFPSTTFRQHQSLSLESSFILFEVFLNDVSKKPLNSMNKSGSHNPEYSLLTDPTILRFYRWCERRTKSHHAHNHQPDIQSELMTFFTTTTARTSIESSSSSSLSCWLSLYCQTSSIKPRIINDNIRKLINREQDEQSSHVAYASVGGSQSIWKRRHHRHHEQHHHPPVQTTNSLVSGIQIIPEMLFFPLYGFFWSSPSSSYPPLSSRNLHHQKLKAKMSNKDNNCSKKSGNVGSSSNRTIHNSYNGNHMMTSSSSSSSSLSSSHSNRIILFSMLIISTQILFVSCMLDALKALFILTGASTYLVTKYVNISQQQQHLQAGAGPVGPFSHMGVPAISSSNHSYWMSQWPKLRDHLSSSTSASSSSSHQWPESQWSTSSSSQSQWLSSPSSSVHLNQTNGPMILTPGGIDFLKGDHQQPANPQQQSSLLAANIRPIYVLAIEEEEDERRMPKSLLNLSISMDGSKIPDSPNQQKQNQLSGIQVDYILDAKMDDYAQVFKYFTLNRSTGELFLIRPLDRDPPNGRSHWRFSIQARNHQTQLILAIADVAITVRDINDNKPLFEQKLYQTTLIENGPAGQVLTKLQAVDFDEADTSDNGKVLYSLVKSPIDSKKWTTDLFQIDPHTGVLTVLDCCFDREKRSEYRLDAKATDAGGLWDEAKILVSIGDLNDNPPKFLNPSRTLRLDEIDDPQDDPVDRNQDLRAPNIKHLQQDENIYTFYITDEDLPESNHHNYEINNATHCPLFQRFYFVVNADGSGTLYGTRRNLSELQDYWLEIHGNQTKNDDQKNGVDEKNDSKKSTVANDITTCNLSVVVRDSVRDSITSSGTIYEDHTTLTLQYQLDDALKRQRARKNHHSHYHRNNNGTINSSTIGNSSRSVWTSNNTNANAVIAPDNDFNPNHHDHQSGFKVAKMDTLDGLKASQTTNDVGSKPLRKFFGEQKCSKKSGGALCRPEDSSGEDSRPSSQSYVQNTFNTFKQWLGWSDKNLIHFALIMITANLIVLVLSGTYCLFKRYRPCAVSDGQSIPPEEMMTLSPVIANAYYQIPTSMIENTTAKLTDHMPNEGILASESITSSPPLLAHQPNLLDAQANMLISYELATPSSIDPTRHYLDLYNSDNSNHLHTPRAQIIKDSNTCLKVPDSFIS